MIDLLHLGQGPRPDLMQRDLEQQQEVHRRVAADASKHHLATLAAKDKVAEETKADHKDIVAMILALFRVLLPWILGAIAIFFVVIFLITRI